MFKKRLIIDGAFGGSIFAVDELFAYPFAKIFVGYDAKLMELTVYGFRIFTLSFCFMKFAIDKDGLI